MKLRACYSCGSHELCEHREIDVVAHELALAIACAQAATTPQPAELEAAAQRKTPARETTRIVPIRKAR